MRGIAKRILSSHLHIWIFATLCICEALSQNTPPQLHSDREWILLENDPIDQIVTRLLVSDDDDDDVNIQLGQPSSYFHNNRKDGYSYFKIDSENRVRIAKSLKGMAGDRFIVGVIANDGTITNRVDVQVTIKKPNQIIKPIPSGVSSSFDLGLPPPNLPHYSFSESNEVPLLHIDPDTIWTIRENASVGQFLLNVEASDYSNTYLRFSLEPSDLLNINPDSGDLTVARSLAGKIGDHPLNVTVSNDYNSLSEKVTLRIVPSDSSVVVQPTTENYYINIIPKDGGSTREPPFRYYPKQEYTTSESPSIIIEKVTSKTSNPPTEKEVTLGWTIGLLVLVFGVLPLVLLGFFLLWRWRRIQNLKSSATKELSVSYSEKRSNDNLSEPRSVDNIVDGLFSMVGLHRRAESNGYTEDVKIPNVPTRENSKSSKSIKSSALPEETDEWEFPRHKLRVLHKLDKGGFGQVWKYEATDLKTSGPTLVAVKTVFEGAGTAERKDLLQELKVLKSLGYHPNVVSLLGCCTEKEPVFVILEFMTGGKLLSYLRDSRAERSYDNLHGVSGSLTSRDLTIFALQAAKGMDFLSNFGIIHRDLAARNILIGEDKVCKVADFGLARDVAINQEYERKSDGKLPLRWMAPESFDNKYTTKSDVWSFGILLWEIVTLGSIPYEGVPAQEMIRKVKDGYRLEKPNHCRREIYNIMYYCWDECPEDRPSFAELVHKLESLIQTEVDYIQLDNFPDHSYYNFNSPAAATGELL